MQQEDLISDGGMKIPTLTLAAQKNRTVSHVSLNSDLGKQNAEQCYMEWKAWKEIYCRNRNEHGKNGSKAKH